MPDPDDAFAALTASFPHLDMRRSGDEAVLMFRWSPHPHLFGVPVSLTQTGRRLDWDQPASDLNDWLESVDLWLMEDVENDFLYRARRRQVDDYIELREPKWPLDDRFCVDVVDRGDPDLWLRVPQVQRDDLDPTPAMESRDSGTLLAWITAYENNSTGSPYVGQASVIRHAASSAELSHLECVAHAPATLVLDLVRTATHAAAESGVTKVVTRLPIENLAIAGFLPDGDRLAVDTSFLEEDPAAADVLFARELSVSGAWGRDRDRAGRFLPRSGVGRLLHRLRHGRSGARPRTYAG